MSPTDMRERPVGDLLGHFAAETATLIGLEMELARAEVGQQVTRAKAGAGMFAAAAVLGLAALGALTACAVVALAEAMPTWLAALIVGAALLAVAAALAMAGRARVRRLAMPVPERAIDGIRSDIDAVQDGVTAGRNHEGGTHDGA